jgi:26S proteasome regulatory subunit N3
MTDVESTEEVKKDADVLTLEDIRQHIKHVEKAVSTKEPRFMSRALRAIITLR